MPWRELMLSRSPQWETTYQGLADARYAEWAGLYYEVTVSSVTGWLFIDRIDHLGHYLGEFAAVVTDAEAKTLMRDWSARTPVPDEAFEGAHVTEVLRQRRRDAANARNRERRQSDPDHFRAIKRASNQRAKAKARANAEAVSA